MGNVSDMVYNDRHGLFVGGSFEGVGIHTGSAAMFTDGSDVPDPNFPRFYEHIQDIISDDNGGWYVAGSGFRMINENDSISYNKWGVVHVLPNNQIDMNFTLNLTATLPALNHQRSVVIKLLKKGSKLYAIGDFNDSNSYQISSIVAVDASTGTGITFPKIKGIVQAVEVDNVLYAVGGTLRDSVDTYYNTNLIAFDLVLQQRKNWTPTFTADQRPNGSFIYYSQGKIIVDYYAGGSLSYPAHVGIAAFDTTNSGTVSASWTYQVPYAHSLTIGVQGLFFYGQAVYVPVWRNDDTYVLQALNVANGTPVSGWNVNTFIFRGPSGFPYNAAVVKAVVVGSKVYLHGRFNQVNDSMRNNWAAIDLSTNQITPWDLQASSVVTNSTILYAHGNKLFCLARSGDSYYKYTSRPHLALLNPVTQEVIPKTFPFLPTSPTNTWSVYKMATVDNTLWVVTNGQNALTESIGAYDIPTGDKVNSGSFQFMQQGYRTNAFTKLIPVDSVLYTLGNYSSVNGQNRLGGMAAITTRGNVLPFTLTTDSPSGTPGWGSITDFVIIGDLLYISGSFTQINGVARKYLASVNRFTGQLTNWNPNPASPITSIAISGNNVFVSGTQNQIGTFINPKPNQFTNFLIDRISGKVVHAYGDGEIANSNLSKEQYVFSSWGINAESPCPALTYYNTERKKYGAPCFIKRPQWYTPQSAIFAGNRLFFTVIPGYNENPRQSLFQVAFPQNFFSNQVEYFPRVGSNGGLVTINFYGYNLSAGTKVRLLKNGQIPIVIPDSVLSYPDNFRVQAVMNLRDKAVGDWDIELTLPNYQKVVVTNGFKIKQATPPDMHIRIIAPGFTRPGRPTKVTIAISNRGEGDAYLVPFWIDAPINTTIKLPVLNAKDSSFIKKDTIYSIEIITGGRGPGQRGWIALPRVGGGEVAQIPMIFTPPQGNLPLDLCGQMGDPLTDPFQYGHGTLFPDVKQCLDPIFGAMKDVAGILLPDEVGKISGFFDNVNALDEAIREKKIPFLDIGGSLVQGALDNLPEGGAGDRYAYMKKFGDGLSKGLGYLPLIGNVLEIPSACEKLKPKPKKEDCASVPIVASQDPNDKIGPMGVHAQRYITDKDPLSYQIRFENYATATAAAQLVQVLDTLDASKYDFSSFQFGHFNVADTNFYAPPGRKTFLHDWDMRPAKDLILRMEGNFNDVTGILKATYTTLDPATMELTEDPILGFLPPNHNAPEGEGSIFFSIKSKADLPHSTTISNRASIIFDYNAPIPTPAWTNTLDKTLPQSTVQALPAVSNDTTLALRWGGNDTGAGIKLYTVYVAVNGNPYKPVVTNTSLKELTYIGKADSTYRFYSVAVDSVGNEEPVPVNFDTQTTITLSKTVQSLISGNWNNTATWNCACIPGSQDVITIMNGHQVVIPKSQAARFKKLIMRPNARLIYSQ
ncbi:hypothetical protein GCM10028807_51660 [Spirosoma daeguense]